MATKLVLSSVAQISALLDNNPALVQVKGLAPLTTILQNIKNQPKTGGCSACQKRAQSLSNFRPQVEKVLSGLEASDYIEIKSLLKLDQLCYYHKVNGKLTQTCV